MQRVLGQVTFSTQLYYISLLSGYGNLDNQCKDPINNNKDCRVGQLTRLHPGFLSVRFISLHRGSEGLQDIKAFQKKMILNVLKSKERFLYPSWYGGLRADCPSVRRGVRSDAQLSCIETRFQKCSQSGKNGSKHPMLSISMAFNVISCKKVERNTQKLKIADFTM